MNKFIRPLLMQEFAILIPFFLLLIFFYTRNEAMLNEITIFSILRTIAFPALIAMGMVQLMIAGELDLSTGAVMSFSAVFTAKLIRDLDFAVTEAVLIALFVSIIFGLLNAFLTIKIGIFSVIATIGTGFMIRGGSYLFTNGLPIYPLPESFALLGSLRPFNLSFTFLLMIILTIVVQVLLRSSKWGTALYATGSNLKAAKMAGINTTKVKTICFVTTSFLSAVAGLLTMSQLPGTPGDPIIGLNLELDILAGVIVGGVSLYGGRGSAIGTFIGVAFIQLVRSGLVIAHFNPYLQLPALGMLLMIAVAWDVIRHKKRLA